MLVSNSGAAAYGGGEGRVTGARVSLLTLCLKPERRAMLVLS